MRKIILAALCGLLLSAPVTEAKSLKVTYSDLYHAVAKKHGKRAPGRNIRRDGVKTKRGKRAATDAELARSIRTFRRWLAPPIPAAAPSDTAPSPVTASASSTGGKWAIPAYIVQRESGGDYGAYNAGGCSGHGCIGAYQIDAAHFAPGGECARKGTCPAGQDRCAATLWKQSGSNPWAQTR
jgi:hypothetical protein